MRVVAACLVLLAGASGPPVVAGERDVEALAWLAGCWSGQAGEPGTVEHWLPPAGGTMFGISRTVRQGKTAEFEFMQLRQLADGTLAFIPQPGGRPPTVFRLTQIGPREAVFENPEHDFPRRISYARPDESRLLASIEGPRNGTPRRIEFVFTRIACDAPIPPAR